VTLPLNRNECLENRLERFCHSGFNRLARVFDVPPGTPPAVRHPLCLPLSANTGSGLHLAALWRSQPSRCFGVTR
jgi:hypothetical protein